MSRALIRFLLLATTALTAHAGAANVPSKIFGITVQNVSLGRSGPDRENVQGWIDMHFKGVRCKTTEKFGFENGPGLDPAMRALGRDQSRKYQVEYDQSSTNGGFLGRTDFVTASYRRPGQTTPFAYSVLMNGSITIGGRTVPTTALFACGV